MAVYTVQTPYNDNWSKNPVVFKVRTTNTPSSSRLMGFSVLMQDSTSLLWDEIYTSTQWFDNNKESSIDVADICDSQLEYFVAKPWDKTLIALTDYVVTKKQSGNFRLAFWETDNKAGTTIFSDTFYVVKGGVAKEQYEPNAVYNHFFSYADNSNPLRALTYHSHIYRQQGMFFISYYIPYGCSATHLRVTIQQPSPSTVDYAITDGLVQGDLFTFFLPVDTLGAAVTGLTFTLRDSGADISQPITFSYINGRYTQSKIFVYVNSLGGTDVVFMPYNQLKQAEQSRDTFSRFADNQTVPYVLQVAGEQFQTNQQEEVTTGIDSGMLSNAAADAMRGLALSPLRYELDWDTELRGKLAYIPVTVTSKKNVLVNDRNRQPLSQYFEITRAVRNSQYTPGNNNCTNSLTENDWAGLTTPVEDQFTLLLESPLNNPMQIALNVNAYMYVDFGDRYQALINSSFSYIYPDNKYRKVTVSALLRRSAVNFYLIGDGKVTAITGKLPRLMPNFKLSNQLVTSVPRLPAALGNVELENNLLTLIPTLPPLLQSAKLTGNEIEDFETTDIPASVVYLDLSNNKLPVSIVNYILQKLDTNGASNGTVKLEGQSPSAAPTGGGATAATNLIGKGWTVTTD